jgi:hypothetical protein
MEEDDCEETSGWGRRKVVSSRRRRWGMAEEKDEKC